MAKIISLSASNFKKLSAVEITPAGDVITLTGENGAGKSSILDAIQSTLAGGKVIPEDPIRHGEERGQVVVKLDSGLTVTRTFTPAGGSLRVENAEGHKQGFPQNLLDKLIGNLAFDPLAFSRLKSHEQWEQLRELIGLNFEALDAERAKAYDDRTVVGRELLRQQVLLKEIPPSVDEGPDQEVSAAEVIAEIDRSQAHNRAQDAVRAQLTALEANWSNVHGAVTEAEEELRQWQEELTRRIRLRDEHQKLMGVKKLEVSRLTVIECEPLLARLRSLEAENLRARAKQQRRQLADGVKSSAEMQDTFTQQIAQIDATKTKMIADAKFPLYELSFDGQEITYKGVRFAQASDGEKLRVSVAVGMALNPKLRVIFVRDGSMLDKGGLQTISDLAKEHDYQVWMEDNRSTSPTAIEIVDGHLK